MLSTERKEGDVFGPKNQRIRRTSSAINSSKNTMGVFHILTGSDKNNEKKKEIEDLEKKYNEIMKDL